MIVVLFRAMNRLDLLLLQSLVNLPHELDLLFANLSALQLLSQRLNDFLAQLGRSSPIFFQVEKLALLAAETPCSTEVYQIKQLFFGICIYRRLPADQRVQELEPLRGFAVIAEQHH